MPICPHLTPSVDALRALAEDLHAADPVPPDLVARVLTRLLPGIPGARWASISQSFAAEAEMQTPAATDPVAELADELQYRFGAGPCLTAAGGAPVTARGTELALRWPEFGSAVTEQTPVRAVLSHPLPGTPGPASVNFYADADAVFPPEAFDAAAEAAVVCSVALAASAARSRADNLAVGLASSREIAAAVGILMAQARCTYEEAFARLRDVSQQSHRKVRELASEIVFTGALPDELTHTLGRSTGWTSEH